MLPCRRFGRSTRFVSARRQRVAQHAARGARLDHVVDVAALGRRVRVREPGAVVVDQLRAARDRVLRLGQLLAEHDVDGAVGAHHGHLGRRPREVEVGAQVLRAHHVVGAAVRLARDHGQLRHGRLGVRVEQLRAVPDDAAPLLAGARQEARHVDERHERHAERVAGAHEPRRLLAGVDVEHAGHLRRLVADDADRRGRRAARSRRRCSSRSAAWISRKSPSSTIASMTRFMS